MSIQLTPEERQALDLIGKRVLDTKLRAEAQIAAFQESMQILMASIAQVRGEPGKNYRLDPKTATLETADPSPAPKS